MEWRILVAAFGLALVIEGLPYFIVPETVKRMAAQAAQLPARTLRTIGLAGLLAGLLVVFLAQRG